jgi:signal transduction histidine kinase
MADRHKPQLAFAVGLALLVLSAIAAGITIVQLEISLKRVAHAHDVEVTLADLESTLSAAGRAQTGYLTSGDAHFLDQYDALVDKIPAKLDYVRDLIQDIPEHGDSYTRLAVLANRRLALMRISVDLRKEGKDDTLLQGELTTQRVGVADEMNSLFHEMELHEQQYSNRRLNISNLLFVLILMILVATFAISISLLYMNYRMLRAELAERQRAEMTALESQESLRLLSTRLLRLQDEERRKFSRELHDSLGQYLNLIKMNLAALADDSRPTQGRLSESIAYLDRCITETRTISYLLHPPMLDEMGFVFAAKWFLDGFAQRSGIQVRSDVPDDVGRLPDSVELALFRVLQECLTNIHRHSGSSYAEVLVERTPREVILRIRDRGKGLPPELAEHLRTVGAHVGGVGLAGMRERVREQGGKFEIQSNEMGTTVTARMPLTEVAQRRTSEVASVPNA